MSTHEAGPPVVLVPGHWLGAWAWDDVVLHLRQSGRRTCALTLPGLDPGDPERSSRTLVDQADAVERAMAELGISAQEPAVLVGHSGANGPLSIVLDRHPELISRVVWVDSGPVSPGSVFAPDADGDVAELPLPPFDVLAQQASLEGLDAAALDRFRRRAVPEPGPVLRATVELVDDARRDIATTVVCCSIPSEQLMALAAAGHPMFAEVAKLRDLEVVDLPTGHWPMWSRAEELAAVIDAAASA